MKKKVIKQHLPPKRDDIVLSKSEIVEVGKEDTSNPNWKNWVWCISKKTGIAGWVPKQYLSIDGDVGRVIKDYSSVELSVSSGDELTIHYYLNGWAWCTNASGSQGWVPEECFEA